MAFNLSLFKCQSLKVLSQGSFNFSIQVLFGIFGLLPKPESRHLEFKGLPAIHDVLYGFLLNSHSTPIYNHSSCCLMNLTLSFRLLTMNFRSCPIGSSCDPGTPHYYVPTTVPDILWSATFFLSLVCFAHAFSMVGKFFFPCWGQLFFLFFGRLSIWKCYRILSFLCADMMQKWKIPCLICCKRLQFCHGLTTNII